MITNEPDYNGNNCTCAQFELPFPCGASLPDHVSQQAGKASCRSWIDDFRCYLDEGRLPIGDGRWALPADTPTDGAFTYPVPLEFSPFMVFLVAHQWVEEPPSEKLAELLAAHPAWGPAKQEVIEMRAFSEENSPPMSDAAAQTKVVVDRMMAGETLRCYGLPHTPATVDHLFAQVDGTPATTPARGLLVTTIFLVGQWGCRGGAETVSTYPACSQWVTDDLLTRAARRAREHANWWHAQVGQGPPSTLRERNRRQPDHLAEIVARRARGELTHEEYIKAAILAECERLGVRSLSTPLRAKLMNRLKARLTQKKRLL